jgi:lysophospholipase L1-like esterase
MRRSLPFFLLALGPAILAPLGCSSSSGDSAVPGSDAESDVGNDASGHSDSAVPGSDAESDVGNDASGHSDSAGDARLPPADAPGPDSADDGGPGTSDASSDGATDVDVAVDGPADAAPPYNPCPPRGTPCLVMPLGDSITFGLQSSTTGGYRVPLFQKTLDAHQTISFVGSQSTGPQMVGGVTFPRANEGHSGYTIDTGGGRAGIQPLVQSAIQTYKPHIVTLMIGTNDVDIPLDLANAPGRLAKLIDTILATDPNLLLVVAQITPTQDDAENARDVTFNAAIPGLVSARAQQGKHIAMVDMYGALTANPNYKTLYLANNLHPNDAGFVVMGDIWYAAIGALFR